MVSRRALFCYLAGVTVVASLALCLMPEAALAQSSATSVSPLPQRRVEPPRRVPAPVPLEDDATSRPVPTPQPAPRSPDDGEPNDPNAEPQDGEDPGRAERRRSRDGEPLIGVERVAEQDGEPVVGEPPAPPDGEPDTERDPRLKSDVDAFEAPPAGYDAVAFQIDSIDPILDRRPARLARFEPFDPLGIKRGSWIIFPEIEFGLGATTNVRRSRPAEGAGIFDVRPTVRAVTNWNKHAMELKATGFASAFPGFATENDKSFALEARGRIDFSKRTNVEVLVSHQLEQERRSASDALDTARERTNFTTTRAAAAVNHRLNRLSLQLRGSLTEIDYAPVATVAGGTASNAERDRRDFETGARATWQFNPALFAFTDVALNDRGYRATPSDGISRDSQGWRVLTGFSFGNTGKIWRGEVGVGWGTQRPDDSQIASISGVILDANLAWRINELSSLLLTARTDFNDSTSLGQSGSRAQTFGIEGRHAFRRHLIGMAALRNTMTDFKGAVPTERETTAEIGFDYFLNRTTTLTGRYAHTDFATSAGTSDYTVDTVRFGVRIRQ